MPSPRSTEAEAARLGVDELAPAKVNLALHVTGRRADGYHLLDSLVVFASLGDRLHVRLSESPELYVDGPEEGGVPVDETNSILRAAALMGVTVSVSLEKALPTAAGIGGGSADAAAVLRAIGRLTGRPLPERPERLGADVPVCLLGRSVRMRGIGEVLDPVKLPPLPAVLVNPRRMVSTPRVFAGLRQAENPGLGEVPQLLSAEAAIGYLQGLRNDLEPVAMALEPRIGDCLSVLMAQPEVRLARMSGSGATCFGLCETVEAAERVARGVQTSEPDWWVRATVLG